MKRTLLILLLCIAYSAAFAQNKQVPVDQAGKIPYIDAELEKKLGLFPGYEGFQSARLFLQPDSSYELLVFYGPDASLQSAQISYSPEEAEAFRSKVSARIKAEAPEAVLNQDGSGRLLVHSTAVSLAFYGPAVPNMLNITDDKAYLGLYMLTSGAGFFVPFSLSRTRNISLADATLTAYGQTRGIAHGILLAFSMGPGPAEEAIWGMGMLGSTVEAFAGYTWANRSAMEAGQAATIAAMGDFGAGLGFTASHVLGFLERNSGQLFANTVLLSSAAGLGMGYWMSRMENYSTGDAHVLREAGLLGAYALTSLAIASGPSNEKTYSATAALGSIGGIVIGHRLASVQQYSARQGVIIGLGEVAGAFVGLGVGYLVSPGATDNYKMAMLTSALGATAGFGFLAGLYANKNDKKPAAQAFQASFNPLGLFGTLPGTQALPGNQPMPLFHARYRF